MGRQLASGGECVLSYTPSLYSIINLPHHFFLHQAGWHHQHYLWRNLGSAKLIHELKLVYVLTGPVTDAGLQQ